MEASPRQSDHAEWVGFYCAPYRLGLRRFHTKFKLKKILNLPNTSDEGLNITVAPPWVRSVLLHAPVGEITEGPLLPADEEMARPMTALVAPPFARPMTAAAPSLSMQNSPRAATACSASAQFPHLHAFPPPPATPQVIHSASNVNPCVRT